MDPRAKGLLAGKKAVFKLSAKIPDKGLQEFIRGPVFQGIVNTPMDENKKIGYARKAVEALQREKPKTYEEAFKVLHSTNPPSVMQGNIKRSFAETISQMYPDVGQIRRNANSVPQPLFGPRHGTGQSPFAITPEKGPFDK
jgi:hypothetical protein